MKIVPGHWPRFGLGSGIPLSKFNLDFNFAFILVAFLVYAWELPGVTGNACNGLTPTVAFQLAMVVYGLVTKFYEGLKLPMVKNLYMAAMIAAMGDKYEQTMCCCKPLGDLRRAVWIDGGWETLGRKSWTLDSDERPDAEMSRTESMWTEAKSTKGDIEQLRDAQVAARSIKMHRRYKVNKDSAWPLAPVWPGVRNPTFEV
eukprot:Gb_05613 [translate_table: standard]